MAMAYDAVILDVDGTLVDSNDAHAHAWTEAFTAAGIAVPYSRARRLIGMGGDLLVPAAAMLDLDDPRGPIIEAQRAATFKARWLGEVKPMPRARAFVEALLGHGLRVAVASAASGDELGALLRLAEVDDLIDIRTSSDDAAWSKPNPDILFAALARIPCPPDRAVFIGDTPYDLEAALFARVDAIAVRSGGWSDALLIGALAIYDDVAELLAQLDTSPIFRTT